MGQPSQLALKRHGNEAMRFNALVRSLNTSGAGARPPRGSRRRSRGVGWGQQPEVAGLASGYLLTHDERDRTDAATPVSQQSRIPLAEVDPDG